MDSRVTPGEFYYGLPCPHCRTFLYVLLDDERGSGRPAIITGSPGKTRCTFCKRVVTYLPQTLERRQAPESS